MARLNHRWSWLCVLAAGLLALSWPQLATIVLAAKPHRAPPPAPTPAPAKAAKASAEPAWPEAGESWVGVILPAQATDVAAPRAGKLEAVHVALGDRVQQGQLLVSLSVEQARLDRVRAEADYAAASAALARTQVEQQHASSEATRGDQLAAEGLASKEAAALARFKLRQSRSLAAEAESLVKEKRARADQLLAIEQDASVRASFAGRVAVRYVDPGASVQEGTPLLRLISEDQLVIRFAAPESSDPRRLAPGQTVLGEPSEGPKQRFRAGVVRVAPEIDSASRMRIVEAVPDEPGQAIARGLIGSIVNVRPPAEALAAGAAGLGGAR